MHGTATTATTVTATSSRTAPPSTADTTPAQASRTASISAWTPDPEAFLDQLNRDYTQEKTPPCRVCGRKLVRSEVATTPGMVAFSCGNRQLDRAADPHGHQWHEHYGQSYWVRRRHGDFRVRALIREVWAMCAQLQALQRFAFGDLTERTADSDLRQLLAGDPRLRARVATALAATDRREQ